MARLLLCLFALAIAAGAQAGRAAEPSGAPRQSAPGEFAVGLSGTSGSSGVLNAGTWPGVSVAYFVLPQAGLNFEFSGRATPTNFDGSNRPFFLDFNLVVRPLPRARIIPEFELGWADVMVDARQQVCPPGGPPCFSQTILDSNPALHLAFGFKIPLGRRFFLEPVYHRYRITTDALGAVSRYALSLGFTFGR